jgi:hypothetical protein
MRTVYRRSPHVLHRNAGPDVIAMLPGAGEMYVVSGPAAVLWDLLSEDARLDELTGRIAELYAQPTDKIGPALEVCLRDLAYRGLVEERRA